MFSLTLLLMARPRNDNGDEGDAVDDADSAGGEANGPEGPEGGGGCCGGGAIVSYRDVEDEAVTGEQTAGGGEPRNLSAEIVDGSTGAPGTTAPSATAAAPGAGRGAKNSSIVPESKY
ncbi:hypothetical protein A4X06_0g8183 [Tilletia controversa]|uniref:Uncharacterized protein n=1 Tax=Tilletia controversa TaxID=13291 RepID=A0A8X7MKQ9_9BASI|nr:hypothetical protein A4X06_0g8183 [Tilletia controversa]